MSNVFLAESSKWLNVARCAGFQAARSICQAGYSRLGIFYVYNHVNMYIYIDSKSPENPPPEIKKKINYAQ